MTLRWFRGRWEEPRHDFPEWGHSTRFFECREDGVALRQVEAYDPGPTHRYDETDWKGEHGMLTDQPVDPIEARVREVTRDVSTWSG